MSKTSKTTCRTTTGDHRWQTSLSFQDIEDQIRAIDEEISATKLRRIAIDMAQDANKWLARNPDRRVCQACGMQGKMTYGVIAEAPTDIDASTE